MIRLTALAGLTLNDPLVGYGAGWPDGKPDPIGIDVSSIARSGFFSAPGDKTQAPYVFAVRIYPMAIPAMVANATFHATVKRTLRPNRNGTPVTLSGVNDDGTLITLSCVIVARQRVTVRDADILGNVAYDVTLRADVPIWLGVVHTQTTSPIVNGGTEPVYPLVELSSAVHKSWRRALVTHTVGLFAYPLLLSLAGANLTTAGVVTYVYVNGWPRPFFVDAATRLWVLVDVRPGVSTVVDVIYGSGLTANPLAGGLDMGGIDPSASSNTTWVYTGFKTRTNQGFSGQWRGENFSQNTTAAGTSGQPPTWELSDTGTDTDIITLGGEASDADTLVVDLPSGVTGAGTVPAGTVTRSAAGAVAASVVMFIKYRVRDNPAWITAWSTTVPAGTSSVNAAFSVPAAVQVAMGIRIIGANAAGTYSFDIVGGLPLNFVVASPTINLAAVANVDYFNGIYRIGAAGAPELAFADVIVPDTGAAPSLSIDALTGRIFPASAISPLFGTITPTDPAVLLEFATGSMAIANTTGGTYTVTWFNGYSPA